jgi:hypothetical protein
MVVIGCNLTEMFGIVKDDLGVMAGFGGVDTTSACRPPLLGKEGIEASLLCL